MHLQSAYIPALVGIRYFWYSEREITRVCTESIPSVVYTTVKYKAMVVDPQEGIELPEQTSVKRAVQND